MADRNLKWRMAGVVEHMHYFNDYCLINTIANFFLFLFLFFFLFFVCLFCSILIFLYLCVTSLSLLFFLDYLIVFLTLVSYNLSSLGNMQSIF